MLYQVYDTCKIYILFILLNRDADGARIKGKGGTAAYTFPGARVVAMFKLQGNRER